ncbi:hypothetical protein ACFLXQ_09545 [Chloroflexota bacterium]
MRSESCIEMQQVEAYVSLLKQLVKLQGELIQVFEATVKIKPRPEYLPQDFVEKITQPEQNVSKIVGSWSEHSIFYDMMWWIEPVEGFVLLEEEIWVYQLHGQTEITFKRLPSSLDVEEIEALKRGNKKAWQNLPLTELLTVDVAYLEGGRVDGVRAWSVYLFAESVGSKLGKLDLDEHRETLKKLVEKDVLLPAPEEIPSLFPWLRPGGEHTYYVFGSGVEKKLPTQVIEADRNGGTTVSG